jgi:hypothetical protein
MSVLNSEFMSDSIREIVPEVAKVSKELSASSVLTGRRRVRIIAQNGQTFTSTSSGGAQTINFLLQDGGAFLDPTSAVLSFDLTTWDASASPATNTNKVVVDDGVWSVFQRMLVSCNSTLLDDIDLLPKKVNSQLYPVVDKSWYDGPGSFMGLWKFSGSAYNGTLNTKYNVGTRLANYSAVTQPATGTAFTAGSKQKNHFMIPLSLLSGFFANEQLLPLPHIGQLIVQLNLADAMSACVASSANAIPAFRIDNLTMEVDMIEVHPTYGALIARLARDGDGLMMPYDAHLVSSQDINGSVTNAQYNVVFSKATQNLRQITTFIQDKVGLSQPTYPKTSTFSNAGFGNIQYRVGSQYYPAFPSQSEQRAFADLQSAFGRPGNSLEEMGLVDAYDYYQASTVANNGTVTGDLTDMFLHAYSFDKLKGAKLYGVELDGINTLSASGAQVVIQLQCAPPANAVIGGVIRYTRIFRIKDGAVSVIG